MDIQPIDLDGPLTGLYELYARAGHEDAGPPMSRPLYEWLIRHAGTGDRAEAWAATVGGEPAGFYSLSFPQRENTHRAWLFQLVVACEQRRKGLGGALLEHVKGRLKADGRRVLMGETPVTGNGAEFAAAKGFKVSLPEARRVLDLGAADVARLRGLTPALDGYRLERFRGAAPEELMADIGALMAGMNDAPHGDDFELMHFDTERVRATEARIAPAGSDAYTMIARRVSDGAPAGYTRIYLEADRADEWGRQADTTVLAAHRGHKLGLAMKLAITLWLHEEEPQITRIITWNATSNAHMLAINEAMGFELLDEWNTWQLTV
ncbi:GNAT family N-acetyltransferase [Nonomuraea sp. NBC_01738]|uniref:GNAT family N-acetyltransferase n=1 Tax=Nonomuraea sp. NBC_01738 TaxID=2976003 RepID=UPI002E1447FF|nr:GNAT family N-acetyltransferase [Nonomuraea sp. NBC_01738]